MENSELFNEIEQKLNKIYDCEIESIDSFLDGTEDIIEFIYDEELVGLYSAKRNKVIYEPEICSDIEFHPELGLISLYSWDNNMKIWIDLFGRVILQDGEILQAFDYDSYFIKKNYYAESSSIGTVGYGTQELYKPYLGSYEDDNYDGTILSGLLEAMPDESGRYLMIKIENNLKEILIGVYDLKEQKWICEKQKIQR
jgi:hypothetical protein